MKETCMQMEFAEPGRLKKCLKKKRKKKGILKVVLVKYYPCLE